MVSHLLVVDDDLTLVKVLREVLVRRFPGATVETCTSADRSLERIAAEDFDTIISDVRMPGTDGLALLRKAHDLRPSTPIVLITGLGDYDLAVRALRGGAFDYITKPVDTDYLVASVARALHVREVAHQLDAQRVELAERAAALAHIVEDQTHELREANRMKDEFLATLSHELRTPLTSVLGWSRLLMRNELDETMKAEALEAIERNATHQARLVDDLLDVSRIMTGKLRISRKSIRLGPIVASAVDAMIPTLQARNIALERDIDMTRARVDGDAERLQQVVSNLLSNAAKFTPNGGRISVHLQCENDSVALTVTDTGMGIPPDFLPNLFTRFCQADAALSRSTGGLGVGLSLVKHFVELHGGTVEAQSAGTGAGATFIVRLPAIDGDRDTAPPQRTRHHDLRGVRVLVVEDDEDSRSFLRFTLEKSGARVTDVMSVAAALDAMDRAVPDVVVCDICMPEEDGYSFIRRVRARPASAGGCVPAAAVTACARPDDVQRALAAGFDVHLAKPVEPRDLADTLTRLAHAAPGRNSTL